jgi:hypothetical protein
VKASSDEAAGARAYFAEWDAAKLVKPNGLAEEFQIVCGEDCSWDRQPEPKEAQRDKGQLSGPPACQHSNRKQDQGDDEGWKEHVIHAEVARHCADLMLFFNLRENWWEWGDL